MKVVRTLLVRVEVDAQTIDPGPQLGPAVVRLRAGQLPSKSLPVRLAGIRVEVRVLRLFGPQSQATLIDCCREVIRTETAAARLVHLVAQKPIGSRSNKATNHGDQERLGSSVVECDDKVHQAVPYRG